MQLLRLFLVLILGLMAPMATSLATSQPLHAQEGLSAEELAEDWKRTATRAEEAIAAARASTPAFETLRADLVVWRSLFLDAQEANSRTIATVQRQLDALGPVPEDGSESEGIAAERQALTTRLAELETPVKTAEIAYGRADGLIRAIDAIIRDRRAEQLLEFGPSPLNPSHWLPAFNVLRLSGQHIRGEFVAAWANELQQVETKEALPLVILLALAGSVLVIRGRRWSRGLMNRVLGDNPGAGRWILGFILSLGSAILPLLGVYLLTRAVYATGLVGLRVDQILQSVVPATFIFVFARWLAMRVFPAVEARALPLVLSDGQRKSGRWFGAGLGLAASLHYLVNDVASYGGWPESSTNVLLFPLLFAASLMLFQIARLLNAHCKNSVEDDHDETYRTRLIKILVIALMVLSVISPVLAAVGYFKLAQYALFPMLMTLQLLAALLVLQRVVVEVYVLVTDNRQAASESLVPVLLGFLMVLMSLPVLALIWGARVADLTELWSQIIKGFDVGGLRLSPTVFFTFAIVFVIGYTATRLLQGTLRNTVLPKTRIDPGGQVAIVSGLGYVGIFLAAVVAITSAGIDLSSIAIVAGALSVGIGFGLQTIVSNFVSGIILLVERPISNGDWIEVGGVHGTVRKISVRSTVIETFDRSDVIVPNSDLVSGRVTNYTHGNTVGRVIVSVGVAYGTDTRRVEKILREIAEAHPMVLLSTPPFIVFRGFGADSLDFEIRAILRDVNWVLSVHSDMNHEIARRFAEEGIEIPFAQRDVWIRNPETLSSNTQSSDTPPTVDASEDNRKHLTNEDLEIPDTDTDTDAGGDGDAGQR
jgi:small-conductance mechanosensitive channel